ncbi:hypothetical protein [Deinococcus enclensis]|uniref:Barstar (barnase inhibitor) domain-containing protein n=1 Tax=Deinococcus enclensis TaxID=1049582 RepID=A0ABT9MG95_9DEIO|nr:hypothetical protein [Deinococcus enclensis]MDP9765491.1 hypothetical protein [Deinococcus enclensis]
MATDAHGWVEVYDPDDDRWDAVIVATHFMDRDYALFGAWFGVRSTGTPAAVAGGRGLPEDLSPHVLADVKAWSPVHSPTWVSWDELRQHPPLSAGSNWRVLLALMETLSETHPPRHVRLVVWFDQ